MEFMFYIRNAGDAKAALSAQQHQAFIKECEVYINDLKSKGQMIGAQPLIREGVVLSRKESEWMQIAIDPSKEVQVGYYHIVAADLEAAIAIAQQNPEFNYVSSASIEIRPVKTKEATTKYVYPKGGE